MSNREIKFRGRFWKTGKWHYGYFWKSPDGLFWIKENGADYRVDPKTVGQYTGVKDGNGKEIYESDIIEWPKGKSGTWSDQNGKIEIVPFPFICGNTRYCKIIGNIYEHRHLLKKETNFNIE